MDDAHKQWKDEKGWRIVVVQTLVVAEKRIKDLNTKLTKADRERKSAEAALAGAEKHAKDQHQQLCRAEDQLTIAKEQIEAQKKELEKAKEAIALAE